MTIANPIAGRVLVVDDQPLNLRVIGTLLSRHGYEVVTADSGEAALEEVSRQMPDLMLLDMLMPGMDGFDLLDEVRKRPEWISLPVVFLTVAQDRDLLLRAFDAGAVDYVTKPFMPEELLARVQAHIGLKLTRDRLERVARERQELVNLVAHDLKNPLSSIFFASELLASGEMREERVPRYLEVIRESTNDALGYIRRYLEAQADHADAAAAPAEGPFRTSLQETLDWLERRYALQFEHRGATLAVASAANSPAVAIDPLVLRQVCENLVSNAIKYAPGSDVTLSVRKSAPGFHELRVEDRGPGIAKSQQSKLFTPFFRAGGSQRAVDQMSSGLGLSLARQIVGNAGGELHYEDREGGGARFVLTLPIAAG